MTTRHQLTVVGLFGLFQDRFAAEKAVSDLHAAGFTEGEIGYAIRGSEAVSGGMITDAGLTKDAEGAKKGALAGGVTGGILGALAALALPGVGRCRAWGRLLPAESSPRRWDLAPPVRPSAASWAPLPALE
jgi:hypothetical protein